MVGEQNVGLLFATVFKGEVILSNIIIIQLCNLASFAGGSGYFDKWSSEKGSIVG